MKTTIALFVSVLGLAASGMAAEVKGFVQDQKCSGNPA